MEAKQISGDEQREHGRQMSKNATAHGVMLPGLRLARTYRDLTVRELAEKAGLVTKTIITLENGRGGAFPSTLEKLARALNVTPYTLYRDWGAMIEEYEVEDDATG